MADLKAAAKRLRTEAKAASKALETVARIGEPHDQCEQERDDFLLAAQALEAWAWQAEHKALVGPVVGGWMCHKFSDRIESNAYVADTPLGAILAAMEGEKDGK